MANLLPSGYVAPYAADPDPVPYVGDYVDAHDSRQWYPDQYYYPAQPVYESPAAQGQWDHAHVSDQYNTEEDLVNHYLDPAALEAPVAPAPAYDTQSPITEQEYEQSNFGGNPLWEGGQQQHAYGQSFQSESTDYCPSYYHTHANQSTSSPPRPYPAHGYAFESKDPTAVSAGDPRPGHAASPQPVDQHDWGNLSRNSHDPRLDFGPFQAPKEGAHMAPEPVGFRDYQPLVPPTSSPLHVPSSRLPYGFVPSQPRLDQEVQPAFFGPSQRVQRLDEFIEHRREKRAAIRAAFSPYYTQDWHHHHGQYERSPTPIMDHLPIPDEGTQPATGFTPPDDSEHYATPAASIVLSQLTGHSPIRELGLAQFEQAREENGRKHKQHLGGRTYIPDRHDLPPPPPEPWARAQPTHARPHPLVMSEDGYHPLVKPEPQEYSMPSASPVSPASPMKADSPLDGMRGGEECSSSSPSTGMKPLLSMSMSAAGTAKKVCDKKPVLACLFCRGRKIACGPPLPGSKDKTCNQCARRHLKCVYPTESRRGQRKRAPKAGSAEDEVVGTSPPAMSAIGSASTMNAGAKGNRKHRVQLDRPGAGT